MRGCIILDWRAKLKRKINFIKELKEETNQKMRTNLFKNNKLNILIKWWNWKQLKVYKRDNIRMKKKNDLGLNLKNKI